MQKENNKSDELNDQELDKVSGGQTKITPGISISGNGGIFFDGSNTPHSADGSPVTVKGHVTGLNDE